MILVDRRYFFLLLFFFLYLIFTYYLVYFENIVYLHSDELTFHNWADKISSLNFNLWWSEIKESYVGLFQTSNAYFTVFWYSIIYSIADIIGFPQILFLRIINVIVGIYTSITISNYIEKFSKTKLSFLEILCISLPFLFFSPTLLRDNYVILFSFLGLISFREKKDKWLLKTTFFALLVFLFRHISLVFFLLLLFVFSYEKYRINIILFISLILIFANIDFGSIYYYIINFRVNFLIRFSDANLFKILSLPFPFNELILLLYSFLGVFPFYSYLIIDLPKSLIRIPESLSSLVMYFYILSTYFYAFLLKSKLLHLIIVTGLFMLSNIEFSLRRQLIVFPFIIELYYLYFNILKTSDNKINIKIINLVILFIYLFLIVVYNLI